MRPITYSRARADLAKTFDAAVDDREEVVVTRAVHAPVVIVALDEYESLKETAYLLGNPNNAQRLFMSISRLESGGGVEHDVIDPGTGETRSG